MSVPASYDATRRSLHAVAEQVLGAARYDAVGRIGLEVTPGGFGAPPFGDRSVRVAGTDLVVVDRGSERRAPLSTLREAGAMVGIAPGMPATVYRATTDLDLDAELLIDAEAARTVAEWLARGHEALETFAVELQREQGEAPTERTLWPEHFDLAMSSAEVNYGVSPGDDAIPEPYAYVGPWTRPLPGDGGFWNQPFGAAVRSSEVSAPGGLLGFFRAGWLAARPG